MPRRHPPLRGLDNPVTVAYLAGLIDNAGGRIRIVKCSGKQLASGAAYGIEVHVHSVQAAPIDWLIDNIGGSWVWSNRDANGRRWRVFGPNAEALIRAVRPYLVRRRAQADLLIEFRDRYADHRHTAGRQSDAEVADKQDYYDRMKALNAGQPVTSSRRRPPPRRVTYADRIGLTSALARHLRAGWTRRKIADHYQVNGATVDRAAQLLGHESTWAMRDALGIPQPHVGGGRRGRPYVRLTPQQDAAIAACYLAGDTIAGLAAFGEVSIKTIRASLQRTGTPKRGPGRRRKEAA
jgi:hypothetical protein